MFPAATRTEDTRPRLELVYRIGEGGACEVIRKYFIIIVLLVALLLSSCKALPPCKKMLPTEPVPTAFSLEDGLIILDHANRNTLDVNEQYHEFYEKEYNVKMIFRTRKIVRNFKLLDIYTQYHESKPPKYFPGDTIYALAELTPDKALVLGVYLSEGIPIRGISFTDDNNMERSFILVESSSDEILRLLEFTPR